MTHLAGQKTSKVLKQTTLKTAINCSGTGLHSGDKIAMTLRPAPADHGIVFKRIDVAAQGALIPAQFDLVTDTTLCTKLTNDAGVSVGTVEHLMAAISGCGVDNLLIEINGAEVPIMDGSSAPFVFLIECAGIEKLEAARMAIRIEKEIHVEEEGRFAGFQPGEGCILDFTIDFNNPTVARQSYSVHMGRGIFKEELSKARTFGFLHEVEYLRSQGLARGGSLKNAVVVSADGVMNEEGLRFENEFVRHKILDAVGDLALAQYPIIGHYNGVCSGHYMNNQLLRCLMANQDAWSLVPMTEADLDGAYQNARKEMKKTA